MNRVWVKAWMATLCVAAVIVLSVSAFVLQRSLDMEGPGVPEHKDVHSGSSFSPRKGIRVPPKDYSSWRARFGREETLGTGVADRERLAVEDAQLPRAIEEFNAVLDMIMEGCTNRTAGGSGALYSRAREIMSCYSRQNCEKILGAVDGARFGHRLQSLLRIEERGIVRAYYDFACQLSDWWWEFGGSEFKAANFDLLTYRVLKDSGYVCPGHLAEIEVCLDDWKKSRCDNPASNLSKAHEEGERLFALYYAEAARSDPAVYKPISSWYRYYLNKARGILGRDPSWAVSATGSANNAAKRKTSQ